MDIDIYFIHSELQKITQRGNHGKISELNIVFCFYDNQQADRLLCLENVLKFGILSEYS